MGRFLDRGVRRACRSLPQTGRESAIGWLFWGSASTRAYRAFLAERGYAIPGRSFAHGQGLSLVERPNVRADEPWRLREGMNIAIHPGATKKGVWAQVCDGFIVGKTAAVRIHKTPHEIVRL